MGISGASLSDEDCGRMFWLYRDFSSDVWQKIMIRTRTNLLTGITMIGTLCTAMKFK